MMTVYAIKSEVKPYIYVGMTNNLDRRLAQHNCGKEKTTRSYAPFTLALSETYPDRPTARAREKHLKSGIGKEFLKSMM